MAAISEKNKFYDRWQAEFSMVINYCEIKTSQEDLIKGTQKCNHLLVYVHATFLQGSLFHIYFEKSRRAL